MSACSTCGGVYPCGRCAAIWRRLFIVRCKTCQQMWVDWRGSSADDIEPTCTCHGAAVEQWTSGPVMPIDLIAQQLDETRTLRAVCPENGRCPTCEAATITVLEHAHAMMLAVGVVAMLARRAVP